MKKMFEFAWIFNVSFNEYYKEEIRAYLCEKEFNDPEEYDIEIELKLKKLKKLERYDS